MLRRGRSLWPRWRGHEAQKKYENAAFHGRHRATVSNRRGGQHTLRPPPESIEKGEAEQAGRNTRGDAGTAGLQRRCFTRHSACQRKADSARSIFHRSRSATQPSSSPASDVRRVTIRDHGPQVICKQDDNKIREKRRYAANSERAAKGSERRYLAPASLDVQSKKGQATRKMNFALVTIMWTAGFP